MTAELPLPYTVLRPELFNVPYATYHEWEKLYAVRPNVATHSVLVAELALKAAEILWVDPQHLYTCGLLHDIWKKSDLYKPAIADVLQKKKTRTGHIARAIHASAGALELLLGGFPMTVVEATAFHHYRKTRGFCLFAPETLRPSTWITEYADHLAAAVENSREKGWRRFWGAANDIQSFAETNLPPLFSSKLVNEWLLNYTTQEFPQLFNTVKTFSDLNLKKHIFTTLKKN